MTIFPVFKKYETGAKELFSECTNLPEEFKDKWNSYFYHRLYRLSWKIDQIQGWIYIERERGETQTNSILLNITNYMKYQ